MAPTTTCRAIDELRLPWPHTRTIWRRNPIFRREPTPAQSARGEGGNVNHCAIDVLEDIIGWYRIKRTQNEATGQIVVEERLFDADALQKDYGKWAKDLGYTKRQVQDAVALLHNSSLICRWCAVRTTDYGVKVGNAVFLEPYPDAIRAISRPVIAASGDTPPLTSIRERRHVQTGEGSRIDAGGVPPKRETPKSLKSASKPQANPQQQEEAPTSQEPLREAEPPVVVAGSDPDRKEANEIFEGDDPVLAQVASPLTLNRNDGPCLTPNPSRPEMLLAELVSEGMGEGQARMAVRDHYDIAVYQLENLRCALPGEKILPSRGGWLYKAITTGYGPTKGYAKYLEVQKSEEARREAQLKREAERQARIEAERVSFDEFESDLSPEDLKSLRQCARNCVHPDWRRKGEDRCAKLVQANYDRLLRGAKVTEFAPWPIDGSAKEGVDAEDAAVEKE